METAILPLWMLSATQFYLYPEDESRKIWLHTDELATLDKLFALMPVLTKGRKKVFASCLVCRPFPSFMGFRDFPSKNDKVLWRPRRPWPPEGYYFSLTGKYPQIERISSPDLAIFRSIRSGKSP